MFFYKFIKNFLHLIIAIIIGVFGFFPIFLFASTSNPKYLWLLLLTLPLATTIDIYIDKWMEKNININD